MKKIYIFLLGVILSTTAAFSQTVLVGGQCITGTITTTFVTNVNGKPAYAGTGTVQGVTGVVVTVSWLGAPDNVWVISFDGQPYFQNSCNTNIPPGTILTSCTWTAVSGQTCTGGTALSVAGAVVVPVTLTDFSATRRGNDIVLNWTTGQEQNNKGFTIQKTNDVLSWLDVGYVNGKGFSTTPTDYKFTDKAPYSGINLYRLKQEDYDGKITYSPVAKVEFTRDTYYTISDNPGKGVYKINITPGSEKIELSVTDVTGRIVYRKITASGNQLLDISSHAAGMYWLKIKKGNTSNTEKIIKL